MESSISCFLSGLAIFPLLLPPGVHLLEKQVSRRTGLLTVEAPFQDLTGLERQNPSRRDLDVAPGLRVSAPSRPFLPNDEISKPGDLDLIFLDQGVFDDVKNIL